MSFQLLSFHFIYRHSSYNCFHMPLRIHANAHVCVGATATTKSYLALILVHGAQRVSCDKVSNKIYFVRQNGFGVSQLFRLSAED